MTAEATAGWYLSDRRDFQSGIDATGKHGQGECIYLKSVVPRPKTFGFLSKSIDPTTFLRKRLKFHALLKTDLPDGASAQLWLRVDGDWKERAGCFDNMHDHGVKGQTDWAPYEVAVDVPATSQKIVYGVLLNGTGQVWLADVQLEPAG